MDNNFQSDDILLCAYLLTQDGVELVEIVNDAPYHFVFKLSDVDKCNKLKRSYLNNALAPARELFSQREMLISEIKSRDRYGDKKYGKSY